MFCYCRDVLSVQTNFCIAKMSSVFSFSRVEVKPEGVKSFFREKSRTIEKDVLVLMPCVPVNKND